jgi:hypothetical protein
MTPIGQLMTGERDTLPGVKRGVPKRNSKAKSKAQSKNKAEHMGKTREERKKREAMQREEEEAGATTTRNIGNTHDGVDEVIDLDDPGVGGEL